MSRLSHLLQMRGLKLASFAVNVKPMLSHLLQMRGLKLLFLCSNGALLASHLLQMRGLKHPYEHEYKQSQ